CLAAFTLNLGKCSITRAELRVQCQVCSWLGSRATVRFSSSSTLSVQYNFYRERVLRTTHMQLRS
ncbi:hypothetical protein LINPERPRIM_LOCUS13950, partial [Linum perenne]